MFFVDVYMDKLICALKAQFADRLLYVGLQGSYLRGEATENSDLDVVVILEDLTAVDLAAYKAIVNSLEMPEMACGFICGRQEMAHWNPLESCNFLYGTQDRYGKLADFVPAYTREDVVNFVKLSVGNLYHELCHRYVHADVAKNRKKLPQSFKSVFFILQSLYYLKDGVFYPTKQELLKHLCPDDRSVMELSHRLNREAEYDFEEAFQKLLRWCQNLLANV